MRGLTHRAVDRAAGLAEGSASYYFRTRQALLQATVERLAELDTADMPDSPGVSALPGQDLDAFADPAAEIVESWLTTERERQLARYEPATRRLFRVHGPAPSRDGNPTSGRGTQRSQAAASAVSRLSHPVSARLPRLAVRRRAAQFLLHVGPEGAVANAHDFAEQLLASQRKFTEDLLRAAAPLMPGRAESTAATETYKPGQVVPRDGTVECAPHHDVQDRVKAGTRFAPCSHHHEHSEGCTWQ